MSCQSIVIARLQCNFTTVEMNNLPSAEIYFLLQGQFDGQASFVSGCSVSVFSGNAIWCCLGC